VISSRQRSLATTDTLAHDGREMRAAFAVLLLSACTSPCGTDPLTALAGDPSLAIVVTNANGDPERDILEDYAAVALYADGGPLHEHWLDSYAAWAEDSAVFGARSAVLDDPSPGTFAFLADRRLIVLELRSGALLFDVEVGAAVGATAMGACHLVLREDGTLVVLDASGAVEREIAAAARRPFAIDALDAQRAAVALGDGLAIVALDGAVSTVDLEGRAGCEELAMMESELAVLCEGVIALVELDTLAVSRTLETSIDSGIVALSEGWIAGIARGEREDGLVLVHVDGGAERVLHEEAPGLWGAALGEGAFGAGTLSWPSVTRGVLRWRLEGDGGAARFTPSASIAPPSCYQLPARAVRALAAP
jgi:hypothetical protein